MLRNFEKVFDVYSFSTIVKLAWQEGDEVIYIAFKHWDQWSQPPPLLGMDILSEEFRKYLYEMITLHQEKKHATHD